MLGNEANATVDYIEQYALLTYVTELAFTTYHFAKGNIGVGC